MARVSIDRLGKDAPGAPGAKEPVRILGEVSLEIGEGEFLVLVGPSGCGKTTLLRCIAGLEEITRGELRFEEGGTVTRMNEAAPRDRDVAMVFQSYALYPHLTVRDNLGFALSMKKTPAAEIRRRVDEAAEMLEIAALLDRYPRQLSGGQRQRVAMGRAVVRRPKVFLFDEPLSNLDASLRGQMRVELKRLHARLGATMVYVTHDQVEAMTLADRIALLRAGAVVQAGSPTELYERPATLFAARFFGTPEMNAIDGEVAQARFRGPGINLAVGHVPDGRATLGVRAEDITIATSEDAAHAHATVDVLENLGWDTLVHLVAHGNANVRLVARVETRLAPRVGQRVGLRLNADRVHLFAPGGERLI